MRVNEIVNSGDLVLLRDVVVLLLYVALGGVVVTEGIAGTRGFMTADIITVLFFCNKIPPLFLSHFILYNNITIYSSYCIYYIVVIDIILFDW